MSGPYDTFLDYLNRHKPSEYITSFSVDCDVDDYGDDVTYEVSIYYYYLSSYDDDDGLDRALSQAKEVVYDALDYVRSRVGSLSSTSSGTRYRVTSIKTYNEYW